jgi:hypothetical protein
MALEAPTVAGDDTRGVITLKLLEGHQLEPGSMCDNCAMLRMYYWGRVSWVVCHWGENGTARAEHGGAEIGIAWGGVLTHVATIKTELYDKERDILVSKDLSQSHNRSRYTMCR